MTKNAKIMLIVGAVLLLGVLLFKFLVADKPPGQRSLQRGVQSIVVPSTQL